VNKRAIEWVFEECDLPGVDRMVLAVYAYHADSEGQAGPSLSLLVKQAGVSRRTAISVRQRLVEGGHLVHIPHPEGDTLGARPAPLFRLMMGSPSAAPAPLGGDIGGVSQQEQLVAEEAPKDNGLEQVRDVFEFWKNTFNRNGRTKLTEGRRRALRARLREGYEADRIKRAILGCAGSDFHVSNGHTDLTLICRNGEKLERFESMPVPRSEAKRERKYARPENRAA
jgi:hypothetical protein